MKRNQSKLSVYMIVIMLVLAVGIPAILMCVRMTDMYAHQSFHMESAHMNADSYEFLKLKPLSLAGDWNLYDGVYLDADNVSIDDNYVSETVWLPTKNLKQAKATQTYQMFLSLDVDENVENQLYISIPLTNPSIRVYLNGHHIENGARDDSWLRIRSENGLYPIKDFYDSSLEYQEIIISVVDETDYTNLYNRDISISTYSNYIASERVSQSMQMLLIGMMLTIIIVGLSYMVLVPSFTMLTMMNLFDTAMMMHILFNMSTIPSIALATMGAEGCGTYLFRQLDLGFFMLAGSIGIILGKEIYTLENKLNRFLEKPVICLYLIVGFFLAMKPELLDMKIILLIIGLTMLAFVGIAARIIEAVKAGQMNLYRIFHVIKTAYIGSVILLDLLTLNSSFRNPQLLFILYSLFFLVHLFIKAYEYRLLFVNIEIMNQQLETTVQERTMELQIANKELHEISTKDALTRAHNRLYFEEKFDNYMHELSQEKIANLYLCMFDLDGFKQINDTYGHVQGDEQLKETAKIVFNHMNEGIEFARIGGEEFALLFVNQQDEEVLEIIESIRYDLDQLSCEHEDRTTGSFGVYKAKSTDENKRVYSYADQCMYYSKQHGKNQITFDFGHGIESTQK